MYSPGKILYFDPFNFKNGTSKPKYFIVIHNDNANTILASLPTSKDFIPSSLETKHGCINSDDKQVNCYHFEANRIITTNNWSFSRPTFVYGAQVDMYDLSILNETYQVEGVEYEVVGVLKKEEFKNLLECFVKSGSVKRKFKAIIASLL